MSMEYIFLLLSLVSLLSISNISPHTMAVPRSRVRLLRGTGLPFGTCPSSGLAVSGIICGRRLSPSRISILRLAVSRAMDSS